MAGINDPASGGTGQPSMAPRCHRARIRHGRRVVERCANNVRLRREVDHLSGILKSCAPGSAYTLFLEIVRLMSLVWNHSSPLNNHPVLTTKS